MNAQKIEFNVTPDNANFLKSVREKTGLSFSEYLNSAVGALKDMPADESKCLSRIYDKEATSEESAFRDTDGVLHRTNDISQYRAKAFRNFSSLLQITSEASINE